jgi:Ala-tRNA(Pro) deacylase
MAISRSLKNYLEEQGVQYDVVRHVHTESSMHTAAAAHVPGDRLAKSVLVVDEEGCLLVVVPSSHRVQLGELDRQLERNLGLATEDELRELFKDCKIGAIPPVGAAYGIETVVDENLTKQPEVWFEAGDHELLIHVSGEQFSKLVGNAPRRRFSRHV